MGETPAGWGTPVGRGFTLLAVATAATGFAMAAQQNIVANYFARELGLAGPRFGYITAIREIPGFLPVFLTALCYHLSLSRLTTVALTLLAIGYGLFGLSSSFWTVAPWVVISSIGYHTWLQTQYALGMSLTTEERSGTVLGRLAAINNAGALVAMLVVLVTFRAGWLTYRGAFAICGLLALLAAVAVFGFPNLLDGEVRRHQAAREPLVPRRDYRYYYALSLLDGGRRQIFFSFGLWVLVHRFGLDVPAISAVLLTVTALSMVTSSWISRALDRQGERRMLAAVNIVYIVALAGYALVDHVAVALACYVIYSFIFPLSALGAATYLQQIAPHDDLAPTLAMGLTMQHAAGFAGLTFTVTRRLTPEAQKSIRRRQEDAAKRANRQAPARDRRLEREPPGLAEGTMSSGSD